MFVEPALAELFPGGEVVRASCDCAMWHDAATAIQEEGRKQAVRCVQGDGCVCIGSGHISLVQKPVGYTIVTTPAASEEQKVEFIILALFPSLFSLSFSLQSLLLAVSSASWARRFENACMPHLPDRPI